MGDSTSVLSIVLMTFLGAGSGFAGEAACDAELVDRTLEVLYTTGPEPAEALIRACAESGDTASEIALGLVYDKLDRETAGLWSEKAALKGHAVAQYKHYQFLNQGPIIHDDAAFIRAKARALEWAYRAALQGHPSALSEIADSFRGWSRDFVSSYMWFELAKRRIKPAHGDYDFATEMLHRLEEDGLISEEGRNEALRLADVWDARHPDAAKSWPSDSWVDNLKGASASAMPAPHPGPVPGLCETFSVALAFCPTHDPRADSRENLAAMRKRVYESPAAISSRRFPELSL